MGSLAELGMILVLLITGSFLLGAVTHELMISLVFKRKPIWSLVLLGLVIGAALLVAGIEFLFERAGM